MTDEEMEIVRQLLRELLSQMGIEAEIETRSSEGMPVFNLKTADSSLLIGQHGANLESLQYLVRILSHKKLPAGAAHFIVDVEGYKKSREEFLKELARQAAERVRETRESLLLKPMAAYERRVIHEEISKLPDIVSESSGDEPERRVLIKPKQVENNS